MSFYPCMGVSSTMVRDGWTWIMLVSFIQGRMHVPKGMAQSIPCSMIDYKDKTLILHKDKTWIDVEYISRPMTGYFKVRSFIMIME